MYLSRGNFSASVCQFLAPSGTFSERSVFREKSVAMGRKFGKDIIEQLSFGDCFFQPVGIPVEAVETFCG